MDNNRRQEVSNNGGHSEVTRIVQMISHPWMEMNQNFLSFTRINPRKVPPMVDLSGKYFIVTGGNRGFGRGVSLELAERNAHVIIGARGESAAKETILEASKRFPTAPTIIYVPLDLSSYKSIQDFSIKIKSILKDGALSGLVNNAALWMGKQSFNQAIPEMNQPQMEPTWAVNMFGLALLTNLLIENLAMASPGGSGPGRIVNVSSLAHLTVSKIDTNDPMAQNRDFDWIQNYSETKLALMFYTKQLAKQLREKNILVYGVDPGMSQTELTSNFATWAKWAGNLSILRPLTRAPIDGSRSIIFPLLLPAENYDTKKWYFCDGYQKNPGPQLKNEIQEKNIWKMVHSFIRKEEPKYIPSK